MGISMVDKYEKAALKIADKYKGEYSDEYKIKHLATEVVELAVAITNKDVENIREEVGDCMYLLLHIFSRHNPRDSSIMTLITEAANKVVERGSDNRLNNAKKIMAREEDKLFIRNWNDQYSKGSSVCIYELEEIE